VFDFGGHTFHDLRHTCATLLLGKGVSPLRVAQRLGQSTTRTTLDVYAHVLGSDEDEPGDVFEALLGVNRSTNRSLVI
jgi:integrase